MNPIHILSASIVVTGASLIVAARYYTRGLTDALLQHHQSVATALDDSAAANGKALQSTTEALERFATAIPAGAKIFTHAQSTTGAKTLRESHTVEFK